MADGYGSVFSMWEEVGVDPPLFKMFLSVTKEWAGQHTDRSNFVNLITWQQIKILILNL